MLEFQDVTKIYLKNTPDETMIFDRFNLQIPKGEFVSIIGSNGSGKTTLLNLICGSLYPDGGRILVNHKDISKKPEYARAKRIGRVFQDPAKGTAASLTVLENLSVAANKGRPYNLSRAVDRKAEERFAAMLEPLGMGLENRLHQRCGTLSGGQRQALALLMSSMSKPDILILDEHTAALDPKSSETVMELTQKLVSEQRFTVVMVTHNLLFALKYGDRLLMMHEGEIIMDKSGLAKQNVVLDDVLNKFNDISLEAGN